MAQKRSGKNSASRITTAAGLIRALDMYFNDTSEASDADKDKPVAITALKASLDVHLVHFVRMLGFASSDFVVLDGADIGIAGSVYTVNNVGYAVTGNTVYKINTGTDTLVDTIRLVVSSTEDGLFQTLDIEDGTSGSGVVDYADIIYLSDILDLPNGNITISDTLQADKVFADTIANEAGTGAPNFSQGLKIAGGTDILDDFEYGTFDVNISVGSGTLTLNSSVDTLDYIKIGNWVWVNGQLAVSTATTPSGGPSLDLPFTNNTPFSGRVIVTNPVSVNIQDFGHYEGSSFEVTFSIGVTAGASISGAASELQNGSVIYISFYYEAT